MLTQKHFYPAALSILLVPVLCLGQVKQATLQELTAEADLILTGVVQEMQSQWNEKKTKIFTRVSLTVNECLKGDPAVQTVEVRQLGGEVGAVGEWYSHTARFTSSEEVLLFVKKDKQDRLRLCRGSNGKFTIRRHPGTDELRIQDQSLESIRQEIQQLIQLELE